MRNESHGIQQKRWSLEIGEETQCGHQEPQKSKRGPSRKTGDFKTCKRCGDHFQCQHKSSGEIYCSLKCHQANRAWLTAERSKCLKCHALVGMTATASGKMIGVSHSVIYQHRKRYKINGGGYKLAAKVGALKRMAKSWDSQENWHQEQWGGVVDSYWSKITILEADKIMLIGKGLDVSNMSENMIRYYGSHKKSKEIGNRIAKSRYAKTREDHISKIKRKLRNHVSRVYRKSQTTKRGRTIEHLGCSIHEAKDHIEKQFRDGMNWMNHGLLWEIDHIIPMSHFNLKDQRQRLMVNHFTNLQPLLKSDNRKKGRNLITNHQMALL